MHFLAVNKLLLSVKVTALSRAAKAFRKKKLSPTNTQQAAQGTQQGRARHPGLLRDGLVHQGTGTPLGITA